VPSCIVFLLHRTVSFTVLPDLEDINFWIVTDGIDESD